MFVVLTFVFVIDVLLLIGCLLNDFTLISCLLDAGLLVVCFLSVQLGLMFGCLN